MAIPNLAIEVYGEFDYIVRSFQFVAGMFSSGTGYMGLVSAVGLAALIFTGIAAISGQALGKGSIQGWILNFLFASVLIIALTGVKCQIIVHDLSTNQFRTVGGVPLVVGTLHILKSCPKTK